MKRRLAGWQGAVSMVMVSVMRCQYCAISGAFQPVAPSRSHSSKSESGGRMKAQSLWLAQPPSNFARA